MAEPTLAVMAEENPKIKSVLEGSAGNTEAARVISGDLGFSTTEAAVRRYRSRDKRIVAASVPRGWEPYAEESGKIGSAIVHLPRPGATERDLLVQAGFDPDCWKISGNVNTRRWMRYDQEWLYYYKFDVEQGESREAAMLHVEDLAKMIRKSRQRPPRFYDIDHPSTYVIVLSDWQIGKSEGGKGSTDTVQRWNDCLSQSVADIKRLQKSGLVKIDRLAILSVGDLVEGCGDHYDMQTFLVDLDRRGQNRVVRELVTKTILTLAPLFADVTIAAIGGNHGENRRKGKAYTTFADNDDVATIEAVREAFDLAGWSDLHWVIPEEELSINVDIGGVNIGLVHGHQFKGGANVLKKAEDWWRGNDFGLEAVQKSQILLSGHFHHLVTVNISNNRTWIQAPTIDPGSKWWTDISGTSSIPGVLTFVATPEAPMGYDFLRVLTPTETEQVS